MMEIDSIVMGVNCYYKEGVKDITASVLVTLKHDDMSDIPSLSLNHLIEIEKMVYNVIISEEAAYEKD